MDKLDFSEANISHIITHFVGNKAKGQTLKISSGFTHIPVDHMEMVQRYLFDSFKMEEYFEFHHKEDLGMHPVYQLIQSIFSDPSTFVDSSSHLAQLLYDASVHPKVIDGEFTVVFARNVKLGEDYHQVIGLFKSETQQSFLKYNFEESHYEIDIDYGYLAHKLDKGCLILDQNAEDGYDVLLVDTKSGSEEARFWKDVFLGVKPVENNFYQTRIAMEMTKSFVESPGTEEVSMSIPEQIALLNKTGDFFKKNDRFDRGSFEENVLQEEELVKGFRNWEQQLSETQQLEFPGNFDINKNAVKKNSKIFRSILKLDKNFSIYIHGDRNMAERGEDERGRYYKFYYNDENYS